MGFRRWTMVTVSVLAACTAVVATVQPEVFAPASPPPVPGRDLAAPEWVEANAEATVAGKAAGGEDAGVAHARTGSQLSAACAPTLKCSAPKLATYRAVVDDIARDLLTHYGLPTYTGAVRVHIHSDIGASARTVWRPSTGSGRDVYLGELSFRPEERKVVAHEMFHALYQSDSFMRTYPDIVVEGLATFAEYRYRYPKKSRQAIAATMLEHLSALGLRGPLQPDVYNMPFGVRPPAERDLLYIAGGHLFMSQPEAEFNKWLRPLLTSPAPASGAKGAKGAESLAAVVKMLGLNVNPSIFAGTALPTEAEMRPIAPVIEGKLRPCELDLKRPSAGPLEALEAFLREVLDEDKLKVWRGSHCPAAIPAHTGRTPAAPGFGGNP